MGLRAVIFGPRSEEQIRDFLSLPKRIYVKEELMQNEKEERAILRGRHILSHYFTITPILVYEDDKAVSRGIVTVYPGDEYAFFGFFESRDNSAAAGLLFHTASGLARDMGLKGIVGPVDCSFWIRYRLKINQFRGPHTGEPYNKEYYLRLWEENGFQVGEQYASKHYRVVKNEEGNDKYLDRLARKQNEGYEIVSPRARDFRKTLREIYNLLLELNGSFPVYKKITEAEFRSQFKYLRHMINYSMVKMAYYHGAAVGFFVAVPNFGNAICGRIRPWQLPAVWAGKKKPQSYVMLQMGVNPEHQELVKVFAETIHHELKIQQVPSMGALTRIGGGGKEYAGSRTNYEYVMLEREV